MKNDIFDVQLFAEGDADVGAVSEAAPEETAEENAADAAVEAPSVKGETETGALRRAEATLGAAGEYRRILAEADEVTSVYPSFDLAAECRDRRFPALIAAGLGVREAYEALHHDEIVAGAMQYAADRVYEAARRAAPIPDRPVENGATGSAAIDPKKNVAAMTESDIRKILKRVQNGEKITF